MANQWIRFTNCIASAIDLVEANGFVTLTMFLPADFAERFGLDESKPIERTYDKKMFIPDSESGIWEALCDFDGKKSMEDTSQYALLRQQIDKLRMMNTSLRSSKDWLETQMKQAMVRPEEMLKRAKGMLGAEPSRIISPYASSMYPNPFYGALGSTMPLRRPFGEADDEGSRE